MRFEIGEEMTPPDPIYRNRFFILNFSKKNLFVFLHFSRSFLYQFQNPN